MFEEFVEKNVVIFLYDHTFRVCKLLEIQEISGVTFLKFIEENKNTPEVLNIKLVSRVKIDEKKD